MHFGLSLTFANPKHRYVPPARLWESQLKQAILAEELGFDHIWIASHHADEFYYPNPFPLLAAVAARTHRVRIGSYIVIMPLCNPLVLAEDAATVDVISNGRLDLGLGVGNFVDEFEQFGISRKERGARMEEGLKIIKGLWTEETFTYQGKHYKVPPFSMTPRPVQSKLPLWVAATVERAYDRAARFEAHLAGTGRGFDVYDECLRKYGHDPKDFNRAIIVMMHLADKEEQAWRQFAPHALDLLRKYQVEMDKHGELTHFRDQPGGYFGVSPLPEEHELDKIKQLHFLGSPFVVGTPDVAVREMKRVQGLGATHPVITMQFGGMDPRLVEHSMRLFASEVMPKFKSQDV